MAHNQSVTTTENTAVAITLVATQANNDPLTYTVASQPTHGKLSGTAPKLTYTPAANYSGPDSFTFYANDGTVKSDDKERDDDDKSNCSGVRSNIGTVSITITKLNQPPVAQNQSVATPENKAVVITLVATQANNDSLTYVIASQPTHGKLSGTAPKLTYTPAANYSGPDSFTFYANDGTAKGDDEENCNDKSKSDEKANSDDKGKGDDKDGDDDDKSNCGGVRSNIATVSITVTSVNNPPVAQNQSVTTAENAPVTITLVATQANNDPLTYAVATQPAHGTLTLNGTGPSATYTPAANYFGPDSFTFTANDGAVSSNTATVSITVTKVNYPPVPMSQSVTTAENTALTITLTGTQTNNDALTFAVATPPAHGTLSGTASNPIYTPSANYYGPDSFTFNAIDGTVSSTSPAAVSIMVTKVNYPPVAQNQSVTTAENAPVTITLVATQANNDPLTYAFATQPAHGTLTLNGAGASATYTPAANYFGPDSFTFTASDGTVISNTATVSITVTKVNYPPVPVSQSVTTTENTALTIALTGTQTNNDALTFAVASPPTHGTLSGTASNPIYTPASNYFGPDSFTFNAIDGTVSSTSPATVSITVTKVNYPPVAQNQSVTTAENAPVTITLVATQANNDPLTYAVATQPAHGTLTLSGTGPSATYTPAANYYGPDSFTFNAIDGTVSSTTPATVSINVTKVNYPPVAASQSVTTTENAPVTITLVATQPNNDLLTYAVATQPAHGTLTLNGAGPSATYTPAANYFGPDSFTFVANDGAVSSNIAMVSIAVKALPVAQNQSVTTPENTALPITLVAVQADGDSLTYTIVTQPAHGTLTLNGTGPGAIYTPAANYFGPDSFTFIAQDGTVVSNTATVSITVRTPPVAQSQSVTTTVNTARHIALVATQANGDPLIYDIAGMPTQGTLTGTPPNVTYTPATNYLGSDSFTFVAKDGSVMSNTATVSITVGGTNSAPVAQDQSLTTNENTALPITLAASDPNNDVLAYVVGKPSHGTITGIPPKITYTPAANYFGPDSFTFTGSDGSVSSNTATITIAVTEVTLAPVAQNQLVTTAENTGLPITLAATQANNDPLVYVVATPPVHGTLGGSPPNVTYTPAANYFGSDSFTFTASDGTVASNTAAVSITVTEVNYPPVAQGQAVSTAENTALPITLVATQPNGDQLTYAVVTQPSNGTLTGTAPNFTYTPNSGYFGPDSFTFTANDGAISSNTATVSITVINPNGLTVEVGPNQTGHMLSTGSQTISTPFIVKTIATSFDAPVGIDYHASTNDVIVSVNYSGGQPYNFELIHSDGTHSQFSNISGLSDEVYPAGARDEGGGKSIGGFTAGTVFCGTGVGGVVAEISPDGSQIINPWVTLPGESGLMRGKLYIDRTGVWGGDLIVSTTAGGIWRINSSGVPTKVASLGGADWEGLTTVPNDPTQYGPWAGKILVGDESRTTIYAIDTAGNITTTDLGFTIEDLNVIPVGENLFGVDYGESKILGVAASAFNNMVGDILASTEVPDQWRRIHWNGSSFEVTVLYNGTGQFEGVNFAPAGIANLPPPAPPISLNLPGVVLENGLPPPPTAVVQWTEVSGPTAVIFSSPSMAQTSAGFYEPGNYVLQLSATDGTLSAAQTLNITIDESQTPVVYAGPFTSCRNPATGVVLNGKVTDPEPAGPITSTWSLLNGPGTATFGNANQLQTTVSFSAPGIYVLQLSATDTLSTGTGTTEARAGLLYPAILPHDPADWWPLNDTPHEMVNQDHDVQFTGALTYGPGEVSQGLVFDGSTAYGQVPAHPDLDIGTSAQGFSIELWANVADHRNTPFVQWSNGTSSGLSLDQDYYGQYLYAHLIDTTGQDHTIQSPNPITTGAWQHFTLTYDKTTGLARLYINGLIVAQQNIGIFTPRTNMDLYLGHNPANTGYALFSGSLDEITLYTRPLTPAEVLAIYNAGAIGKPPLDANVVPTVNPGPDLSLASTAGIGALHGTTMVGSLPGPLAVKWSQLSGPGTTTFADATQADTTATFSAPGIYTLELDADDGLNQAAPGIITARVDISYANPLPTGMADWWPLNDTPHEVVHGNHDVQFAGNLNYGPGEVSQGLVFDGVSAYGQVPSHPDLDIGVSAQGFSIELWANVADQRNTPFVQWSDGTSSGLSLDQDYYGQYLYAHVIDTTGQDHTIQSPNPITTGAWQHFALTYDKKTGLASLYINGMLVAQQNLGIFTPRTDMNLYLGRNPANTGYAFFHGSLDEITLYTRPLTPAEVFAIYSAGNIGKPPPNTVLPTVNPGPDLNVASVNGTATLNGTATAGNGPGPFTVAWSQLSGPGTTTFADGTQASTTATFSVPGLYMLELSANDGLGQAAGIITVRVGITYANPLPAGLADWWPLNDTPHEVVNGNHDVQFDGGLNYGPGEVNDGLVFNGTSAFGHVPAHPDLDIGTSAQGFTIELWANATDYRNTPFVQWSNGTSSGLSLDQDYYGQYLYAHVIDTTGQDHTIQSPNPITTGAWQHFTLTYDKTTGLARLYINGIIVTQQNIGIFTPRTNMDLYLGHNPSNTGYVFFHGSLDEITLYTRPLTPAEVFAIYNAGAIGKAPLTAVPPTVNAGPDLNVAMGGTATFNATATAGSGPGPLTVTWSQRSGPGTTTFANPNQTATTATFSASGLYVLELDASDGLSQTAGIVTVRVGIAYTNPMPAGLADWWPLNGLPHEVVNGHHDVQFVNNLLYGSGEVGQGLVFDGASAYGQVPAHPDLDIGASAQGFSIELWANVADHRNTPFVQWSNSTSSGLSLDQDYYGQYLYAHLIDTTGQDHTIQSPNPITTGAWQHFTLTYDKTTGLARLYINGIIVAQQNLGIFTPKTNTDLFFGHNPANTGYALFSGSLDEITLYTRPLTPAEVFAVYNAGAIGKPPLNIMPPTVNPGPDLNVASVADMATLNGSAAAGSGPGPLTVTWSQRSGPGTTTFANATQAATTATFSAPGLYELELDANDGLSQAAGIITVRVGVTYANPPLTGLADWWPLNGLPHEVINGHHDVQFAGGLAYGPGEVGQGLIFNGSSAFGQVPAHPDLDIGTSAQGFSIELWANVADHRNTPFVQWSNGLGLDQDYYGQYLYAHLVDTTGQDHTIQSSGAITTGTWQHFALTYDKTTGMATLYINGSSVAQQNLGIFTPKTSTDLYLGYNPTNGNYAFFNGSLDEITFFTRPLTAAEVLAIYNAGSNGQPPLNINHAPIVSAGLDQNTYIGVPIQLNGTAVDDGLPNPPGALTYQWTATGPGAGTFGSPTALSTSATFAAAGTYTVTLAANDSALTGSGSATITVAAPPSVPSVSITSPTNNAEIVANTSFQILATATDTGSTISSVAFYNGSTLLGTATVPAVGQPTTYFVNVPSGLANGSYTLTAVATDGNGVTVTSAPVTVTAVTDPGPPYISIATPNDGDKIGNKFAVTGVVASPIISSWTVSYRLQVNQGQTANPWITLASGTGPVGIQGSGSDPDAPDTLGTFDPTMLLNGIYEIQLTATDSDGRTVVTDPIAVVVEGNAKLGQFTLAFNDLTVPTPGVPITVTRAYDSRDTRVGDFGPGWNIVLNDIRVQKSHTFDSGWFQTLPPIAPELFWWYSVTPEYSHTVTATFPDGTTYQFEAGVFVDTTHRRPGDPENSSLDAPVTDAHMHFYAQGSTTGTLEPLDSNNQPFDNIYVEGVGDTLIDTNGVDGIPYDATRFLLTTKDGTQYILDLNLGLMQVTDLNGNTLVLNRDAQNNVTSIVSTLNETSGPVTTTVTIIRDTTGRIQTITDPAGQKLQYFYDTPQGRLTSFIDRAGNKTQFFYDNPNFPDYLTKVLDPLGNQAIRSDYDSNGHLIDEIDADGHKTVFTPGSDVNGNFQQITDRNGNVTKDYYDDQGNIVLKIDPLGGQTSYTFDANNNQTSVTDPLGHKTTMAYDAQNNLLTNTDPLGNTTTYTYNALNKPLTITDERGNVTTNVYDANGNVTQTTDPLGNTTAFTYDGTGRITQVTDGLNQAASITYTPEGWVASATDALGHTTSYTYDSNGNKLTETTTRTKADGTIETLTTNYAYDADNRVTQITFPDGSTTQTAYTADGKQSSVTDQLGHVTNYAYDDQGRLTTTTYADNTSESTGYDTNGNAITATDRAGHITTTTYDALNRVIKVTCADGSSTQTAYDAVGRVTSTTDALGNVTTFGYDAAGHRISVQDALGNTSIYNYDESGNQTAFTDALNHTTTYTYDNLGHQTQVTLPDGTTQLTTYDALGRKVAATDQSRKVTRYRYDANGRLVEVRQYLDQTLAASDSAFSLQPSAPGVVSTQYGYDELGHEISQTDSLGRATLYAYDSLGRRISRTLPGGQTESYGYDAAGNLTAKKDFNGYTTTNTYDVMDRLTEVDADPAHPSLSLADAPAKITYTYNALGQRLTAQTLNANAKLLYSESLAYDSRNRIISKVPALSLPNGSPLGSQLSTLSYGYDAAGNLTTLSSSNVSGVNLAYIYDPLNRLQTVTAFDPQTSTNQSTDYTYDVVGNLQSVTQPNDVTSLYTYDNLNRLTTLSQTKGAASLANYAYVLDPSGHRTSVTELNGRTNAYAYDNLYRLTSETITAGTADPAPAGAVSYTLDKVGNRLSRTATGALSSQLSTLSSSFDANDRLTSDTYDANGNTLVGSQLSTLGSQPVSGTDIYDFQNHLIRRTRADGSIIDVLYDCDGNRVAKALTPAASSLQPATTTSYLVDDQNPTGYAQVLEERTNGALSRVYSYGHDLLSQSQVTLSSGWATSYYGMDGHGSVRQLTDESGDVTDTYAYDAFGNLISQHSTLSSQPTANNYLYCGEQFDADLGLYYLRARYMNTNSGRFWGMDSDEGSQEDPSSLHKYLYVEGDPVDNIDPSGYYSILFGNHVHDAIQDKYGLEHAGDTMILGSKRGVVKLIETLIFPVRIIKPDIVNITEKSYAEIKPLTIYGITTGAAQIATYDAILGGLLGFHREVDWPWPADEVYVDGEYVSFFNKKGIIFYVDSKQNFLELAALVAYAIAKGFPVSINSVQSTLAYVEEEAPNLARIAANAELDGVTDVLDTVTEAVEIETL